MYTFGRNLSYDLEQAWRATSEAKARNTLKSYSIVRADARDFTPCTVTFYFPVGFFSGIVS